MCCKHQGPSSTAADWGDGGANAFLLEQGEADPLLAPVSGQAGDLSHVKGTYPVLHGLYDPFLRSLLQVLGPQKV